MNKLIGKINFGHLCIRSVHRYVRLLITNGKTFSEKFFGDGVEREIEFCMCKIFSIQCCRIRSGRKYQWKMAKQITHIHIGAWNERESEMGYIVSGKFILSSFRVCIYMQTTKKIAMRMKCCTCTSTDVPSESLNMEIMVLTVSCWLYATKACAAAQYIFVVLIFICVSPSLTVCLFFLSSFCSMWFEPHRIG